MIHVYPSIEVQGDKFSPSKVESLLDITLSNFNEPDEIGSVGSYRGKLFPFGAASILPDNNVDGTDERLPEIQVLELLSQSIDTLKQCGAESIVLDIYVEYEAQCNLSFGVDFVSTLAALKVPLTISCVKISDEYSVNP